MPGGAAPAAALRRRLVNAGQATAGRAGRWRAGAYASNEKAADGEDAAARDAAHLAIDVRRAAAALRSRRPGHPARAEVDLRALREPVDLDALAAKAGMSPRNFARRFKAATGAAPLAYVHRQRIDSARHYLENAQRSVQEVSAAVGYEDVAFFRALFRRYTGTSPREYRARFGVRRAVA